MSKKTFRYCMLLILYCVLLVAALVKIDAIIGFLSAVLAVLRPIYIGAAIALILNRPNKFLYKFYCRVFARGKNNKFCRVLSLVSAYILFFAVISILFYFIIPQLVESFKTIFGNMEGYYKNITSFWESLEQKYNFNYDISKISQDFLKIFENATNYVASYGAKLLQLTTGIFSMIANIIFGIVFSIYLLIDKTRLKYQSKALMSAYMSERFSKKLIQILGMVSDILQSYISFRLLDAAATGIFCFMGMSIFNFDYPVFISAMVGIIAIVPVFGAWIGCGVSTIIMLLVRPSSAGWFFLFFFLLTIIERIFLFPKVIKNEVDLPAIWCIFSVAFFGAAFGIWGMLVAIPIAAIIYRLAIDEVKARKERKSEREDSVI